MVKEASTLERDTLEAGAYIRKNLFCLIGVNLPKFPPTRLMLQIGENLTCIYAQIDKNI
jgi:hypothetical protein